MAKSMKMFSIIILFCALFVGTGMEKSAYANTVKKVGASSLNVRTKPGHSANVIGSVKRGATVQVLDEKYGWAKISASGIKGWVASQFLMNGKSVSGGEVIADSLRLREKPSSSSGVVKMLSRGTHVTILSEKYGWLSVETESGVKGWVSHTFISTSSQSSQGSSSGKSEQAESVSAKGTVTLIYDGVNLRKGPGTDKRIVGYAHRGQKFRSLGSRNNWVHIQLPNQGDAWVASWLVTHGSVSNHSNSSHSTGDHAGLQGKTIVVDAGHGGYDSGTIGASGTLEKSETLPAASILASKLRSAGAHVTMTRKSDTFISLANRVNISEANHADAFVSLHYNAALVNTTGIMTFYYSQSKEKALAQSVQSHVIQQTGLNNDGVRFGDYYVLRENSKPAILIELGFLSNASEEAVVTTSGFQEQAADGIVQGLSQFFN
ncbi:N-acetylmuramoyl-L-alanine amidase [Scopulibacillus darangshiensis]|uniref:N-acetylmuramoyl-L-alanine amidase n=1 Tax=Scopulibacillus darangshiensis TaxID=442528 RepID=A0A4R2NV85_9BACL|nr:N-acetylmuramoyl-L-alanine amidase [Scopulibacillus darangshiensis]TCP25993.1 N-acetylmuramoyl-L-alanine amidase [Scopulibacillus darangshiensis]